MAEPAPTPLVVLLDDHTLAGDLFVRNYGRLLAGLHRPLVFVHGDGRGAARALEAAAVNGTPDASAQQVATWMLNRKLTAAWSDAGAVVTGLSGEGRSVFHLESDGALTVRDATLRALVSQQVLPLVASVAHAPNGAPVYAVPAEAVAALAQAWGWAVAVFTRVGTPGLGVPTLPPEALANQTDRLADPEAGAYLLAKHIPLLVTAPPALLAPEKPLGTWAFSV
ncbi:MAG: hypothetical protein IAE99_03740 [Rhodothermales bacterium]|nr:hypothetical protein [Rhodothermales bacterium]